ncbi:MAG: hypothetical protein WCV85_05015 [Patescibacteria group bacterium]
MKNPVTTSTIEEVDYDDPQWKKINESRYAYVGDVTIKDYHETQIGKKSVVFRELRFDHKFTDHEVLAKVAKLKCRLPSRAEAETYIRRRYTPEQLAKNPRIALVGPAVKLHGLLGRAFVRADEDGVQLSRRWPDDPWLQRCRVVVRK